MPSLFENTASTPLPERLRPTKLADVIGQDHLLGPEGPIGRMVATGQIVSMILTGPSGTGKTTIARLLANEVGCEFLPLSAVFDGTTELRQAIDRARAIRRGGGSTILFLDECHRWEPRRQDALLPITEDGTVILIGATTSNVGHAMNSALLSRCTVLTLNRLDATALEKLAERAEQAAGRSLPLTEEARGELLRMADGDGRHLINQCEELFRLNPRLPLDPVGLGKALHKRAPVHDKKGDGHYYLLSALQKSIRGSDAQAATYYVARLLDANEAPKEIFRRLLIMASEEVGMADPQALPHTLAAAEAYDRVGDPEGRMIIAQAVIYLATAPKSNAIHIAIDEALEAAARLGSIPPPKHILNATTDLMRRQGFKDGYVYDHDAEHSFSGQEFFPEPLAGRKRPAFYRPKETGFEREIIKRLEWWDKLRAKLRSLKP